jgi:hypothetical protein
MHGGMVRSSVTPAEFMCAGYIMAVLCYLHFFPPPYHHQVCPVTTTLQMSFYYLFKFLSWYYFLIVLFERDILFFFQLKGWGPYAYFHMLEELEAGNSNNAQNQQSAGEHHIGLAGQHHNGRSRNDLESGSV